MKASVASNGKSQKRKKAKFPWLLFLVLLASIYVFIVLPRQLGPKPIEVHFESADTTNHP